MPFIEDPPALDLKALLSYLLAFLGDKNTLLIINAADLEDWQVEGLVSVLYRFKRTIGLFIDNIIGILPRICTHEIQLKHHYITSIETNID